MAKYQYIAKDINGKSLNDIAEALSEQALVDKLQSQGYFVISIQPFIQAKPKSETREVKKKKDSFTHNNVTMEDILVFGRQLATMLEAGITLLRSLDVINSQVESRTLYKV